jgi:lysophospholipase L1-like esterase
MKNIVASFLWIMFGCCFLPWLELDAAAQSHPTRIVLVGDSTIASGSGWGDAFSKLLAPGVECLNLAIKGRSSKSYRDEGHWQEVLNSKPDWVLIQFGHNDQPGKGPKLETDASTTFRDNLRHYVADVRALGAKPVLITSVTRRNFDPQGKLIADQLVPYVEATRAVANEMQVPLVDLYARSFEEVSSLGPQGSAFFNAAGKTPDKPDTTHLSKQGAEETAKLVAAEIRKVSPELAQQLRP